MLVILYILIWIQHLSLLFFFQYYLPLWGQIKIKFKLVQQRGPEQLSCCLNKSLSMGQMLMQFFHFYNIFVTIYQISKYSVGQRPRSITWWELLKRETWEKQAARIFNSLVLFQTQEQLVIHPWVTVGYFQPQVTDSPWNRHHSAWLQRPLPEMFPTGKTQKLQSVFIWTRINRQNKE